MGKTTKIIRKSIHTFLKHYQYFTAAALIAIPFSASILLSQSLLPYLSLLGTVHQRVGMLFEAAGFPPSSQLFTILNLKLSQTITSSIIVLPFTLSFLLITKASIIQALTHQKPPHQPQFSSFISLYSPLFHTQICNLLLILAANATSFSLLLIAFNCLDTFGLSSSTSVNVLSATSAVVYSIILANALIISNLALVLSGMENNGGCMAILKACVLIRGRTATALSLAVPMNLALAAVEALFQYRVVRVYYESENPNSSIPLEGMFIAYLYSLLIVVDTIVSCVFLKSIRTDCGLDQESIRYSFRIQIEDGDVCGLSNVKSSKEMP